MRLDWLADAIRDEDAQVVEHSGWKTRTMRPFDDYTPVGVVDHHTAGSAVLTGYPGPPYYRNSALEEKCNVTIRGDGLVVVLNAGWAFDSGSGSRKVLDAVRNDQPLPSLAGLTSDTGGNRWFIDIEVQHLGNGDPIDPRQYDALILTNVAICRRMGWDPRFRVVGHREWAPDRKIDPRWNGFANPMPGIRNDTITRMEENMALTDDDAYKVSQAVLGGLIGRSGRSLAQHVQDTHSYAKSSWGKLRGVDFDEVDRPALVAAVVDAIEDDGIAGAVADEIDKRARERLGG